MGPRPERTFIPRRTRTSVRMIMMAGPFWNAPFGGLRDAADFDSIEDLAAFWREGRGLLRGA